MSVETEVEVVVNGDRTVFPSPASIRAVLEKLGVGERGVAVAVDGAVLPRGSWDTPLVDGARVEVLTAVQGG